ncbi:SCO family protein [Aeoliella sp. ICT_H6.2]|uniref:SCO family protein n=1 Tax=Aeoliella straminimaris TaxID=2954799 RepID=A0A9X2F7G5_9BACT|nr:SCO family protein [Aeoliella straminimaris]MCO6043043.1 SCO family protein [Aeoliella straminimaris]
MFCPTRSIRRLIRPLLVLALLSVGVRGEAKIITDGPEEMIGVGVEEKVGTQIPLDLKFRDQNGLPLTLGKVFDGERPVLLTLNYSNCPMLCGRQLNDLVAVLSDEEMKWNAGDQFEVVSVSIDPNEQPQRAKLTHQRYTNQYGRPGTSDGWSFLVGDGKNIEALADTVGFRYKYIPDTGEYAHAAALIVVTPDGVVSRYLDGLGNDPQTVRMSLVEASEGKVGSALDRVWLTCFVYDHTKGRYAPQAVRIMQLGGGVTVVILGLALMPYWLMRRHRHASVEPAISNHEDSEDATPQ